MRADAGPRPALGARPPRSRRWRASLAIALALGAPAAGAQDPPPVEDERARIERLDAVVGAAWERAKQAERRDSGPLEADLPADTRHTRYARLLRRLASDPAMRREFDAEPARASFSDKYDAESADLQRALARRPSTLATSSNAAATVPRPVGLIERAGLAQLVNLAVKQTGFVAADDSAVTLNLNAAGLLRERAVAGDRTLTAEERYRARGWLGHLGGSLTFGSKVPAREITGLSGLPDADKLFDAVAWDVKLRVVGDRDPRAARWDRELIGRLGALHWALTNARSRPEGGVLLTDLGASGLFTRMVHDVIEAASVDVERKIARSLLVSVKLAGQHLSREPGKDTYGAVLLVDTGLGDFDWSLNAGWSAVQQVPLPVTTPAPAGASPAARPFTLKQWTVTTALVTTVLQDAVVAGRGSELTLSGQVIVPEDGPGVPLERKRTWRADVALRLPISKSAEIPFSLTYTNDPNDLVKSRFVRGQFGIQYDFGALKTLARD